MTVPWARPDSGFTLLFEALLMTMLSAMPVNTVARMVGEHDTRLWRVLHHYVDAARTRADAAGVTRVAIDETAARRGHDYITLFVDIDQARVLFATEGRDADTLAAFADDLDRARRRPRGGQRGLHRHEPGLHQGRRRDLLKAAITFDKFHEEVFGWIKTAAGQRKTRYRGTQRVGLAFTFAAAAYNLIRMPNLLTEVAS